MQGDEGGVVDPGVVDEGVESFTFFGVAGAEHDVDAGFEEGVWSRWRSDGDIEGCAATDGDEGGDFKAYERSLRLGFLLVR